MMIRDVLPEDAERLCAIYNHYVEQTDISCDEQPLTAPEMAERIAASSPSLPWLVFCEQEQVVITSYSIHYTKLYDPEFVSTRFLILLYSTKVPRSSMSSSIV